MCCVGQGCGSGRTLGERGLGFERHHVQTKKKTLLVTHHQKYACISSLLSFLVIALDLCLLTVLGYLIVSENQLSFHHADCYFSTKVKFLVFVWHGNQ